MKSWKSSASSLFKSRKANHNGVSARDQMLRLKKEEGKKNTCIWCQKSIAENLGWVPGRVGRKKCTHETKQPWEHFATNKVIGNVLVTWLGVKKKKKEREIKALISKDSQRFPSLWETARSKGGIISPPPTLKKKKGSWTRKIWLVLHNKITRNDTSLTSVYHPGKRLSSAPGAAMWHLRWAMICFQAKWALMRRHKVQREFGDVEGKRLRGKTAAKGKNAESIKGKEKPFTCNSHGDT